MEMAAEDSRVMVALQKKLIADKTQTDNTFNEPITIVIKGKGDLLESGTYKSDSNGPGPNIPPNAEAESVGPQ